MKKEDKVARIKRKLGVYINYVIIVILIVLGLSVFRGIKKVERAREGLAQVQREIDELTRENNELKKSLEETKTSEFMEKEVRDKLGLAREGETVVILPDSEQVKKLGTSFAVEEDKLPLPNWKKWLEVFGVSMN